MPVDLKPINQHLSAFRANVKLIMIRKLLFGLVLISVLPVALAESKSEAVRCDKPDKTQIATRQSFVKAIQTAVPEELKPTATDEGDDDWAEVTFDFQYDESRYVLCSCDIFYTHPLGWPVQGQVNADNPSIYLPKADGSLICAVFFDFTADAYTNIVPVYTYVVIEDYMPVDNATLEINPNMATKTVSFSSYLPDGQKAVLPSLIIDDEWNDEWDFSDANTLYEFITQKVYFEGFGSPASGLTGGAPSIVDGVSSEGMFDIRITEVSDKVILGQIRYLVPWDGNYYEVLDGEAGEYDIMYLETRGTDNLTVCNSASGYKHYNAAGLFQHTPSFKESNCESMTSRVAPFAINSKGMADESFITPYSMGATPDFWLCKSNVDDPLYRVGAIAGILESDCYDYDLWQREQTGIYAPPIVLTDEGFEYLNSANFPYLGEIRPTKSSSDMSKVWPGSFYNIVADEQNVVFGSSFPVNITYIQELRTQYGHPVFVYRPHFVGTAGELRTSDLTTVRVDVKYNGETKCDYFEDLYYWVGIWAMDDHEPGIIEAEFINSNYEIAGVQGANTTVITYDEKNEDKFAPSLEMLRLVSDDGKITQTFTNDNLGSIQFSAGDFYCKGAFFTEYPLAEVKLSVSPYNTSSFTELTVVKNENYSSTVSGFGALYEADMTPVGELQHEGLYDLRIELADESGNTMVQTISPAFTVGEVSGANSPTGDGDVTIWATGNMINVCASGIMDVRIYSLEGLLITDMTADSAASVEIQSKGAYIVSVTTDSGKSATRKIML